MARLPARRYEPSSSASSRFGATIRRRPRRARRPRPSRRRGRGGRRSSLGGRRTPARRSARGRKRRAPPARRVARGTRPRGGRRRDGRRGTSGGPSCCGRRSSARRGSAARWSPAAEADPADLLERVDRRSPVWREMRKTSRRGRATGEDPGGVGQPPGALVEHDARRARRSVAPPGVEVDVYESLADLPYFNPDLDRDGRPAPLPDFRAGVAGVYGVVIQSPEYAHEMPGVLKNVLDWLVGSGELYGKRVAVLCGSPRPNGGAHVWDAPNGRCAPRARGSWCRRRSRSRRTSSTRLPSGSPTRSGTRSGRSSPPSPPAAGPGRTGEADGGGSGAVRQDIGNGSLKT